MRVDEVVTIYEVFVRPQYAIPRLSWQELTSVCDIGANIGASALWISHQAPGAHILAIEPDPIVAERLSTNIALNRLGNRIAVVRAAVGEADGQAELLRGTSSSVTRVRPYFPERQNPALTVAAEIELIELRSLESLLTEHRFVPELIKLDCEGAEYDILLNANAHVLAGVRYILLEYHYGTSTIHQQLIAHLTDLGYDTVDTSNHQSVGIMLATRRS